MKETGTSKSTQELKQQVIEMCKSDKRFAEQLYSELYIYLNYDEELIGVDCQTCEIVKEKPTWTQNFMWRIKQALRMKGIEVEFDTSEMVSIIKQSSDMLGYSLSL